MRKISLVLLWIVFLNSCKEKPVTPGKQVSFREACAGKYWSKEEKGLFVGERIAFPGFFKFSTGLQTDTILLELYETAQRTGKPITVSVRVSGEKNGIDPLPREVRQADIRIHTNGGEVLGVDDRIVVHAEHIGSPGDEQSCLFKAVMLEKG